VLDDNFPQVFRQDTPARFSELFFAAAFSQAGWSPIARVKRFDLAFALPSGGRLLVEVVTPAPQSRDSWTEEEIPGGGILASGDDRSKEAALLRLTSGFVQKARIIAQAISDGHVGPKDYKVIAISGIRIAQETPIPVHASGMPPDFAKAFLPMGGMYVPITLNRKSSELTWGELQHRFTDIIPKEIGEPVRRDAFASGDFSFIDAVAYSEVGFDDLDRAKHQVGVLHNPTSLFEDDRANLRMGSEYFGRIEGDQLQLTRKRLPEVEAVEEAAAAASRASFDELFPPEDEAESGS
jgi:hypothetical protein